MKKLIMFLITIVLATGSCTKKVNPPPVAPQENLTVVIGSVSAAGDTTIYLQTVVKPQ